MQCNESQKQKSSPGSQNDSQLIPEVEHTSSSCSVNNPSLSSGKTPMHCSQPNQQDHQSLAEIQNNVYFGQDDEQATSCRAVTDDDGSKDDITGHDGNDDNDDDDEVSAMVLVSSLGQ